MIVLRKSVLLVCATAGFAALQPARVSAEWWSRAPVDFEECADNAEKLTTKDMPVPTCATCHMSGIDGAAHTHDTTERLSFYLFAPISERRPNADLAQARMQEICLKCHTRPKIEEFFKAAEAVIETTNQRV